MLSYRRYRKNGESMFVFLILFVHAAARGATCAFTLIFINTLIKNCSPDDRRSISTHNQPTANPLCVGQGQGIKMMALKISGGSVV